MRVVRLLLRIVTLVVLGWATILGLEHVMVNYLPAHFVFDAARFQELTQEVLARVDENAPAADIMREVHAALQKEYPGYIADMRDEDWVFNNAGNSMGTMIVLHASLSEYVIFFGSAIGAGGHTGMHFADDYFTILYGEELAALPHASVPERYLPGDQHHMPYGVLKQYSMPNGSFALELAQGYIPTMLPFGLIEVLTTTFDFQSFAKTVRISGSQMIGYLLQGKI